MSEAENTPKTTTPRSTKTAAKPSTDDLLPDDHPHKVAVEQGYFGEVDPDADDLTLEAVLSQ